MSVTNRLRAGAALAGLALALAACGNEPAGPVAEPGPSSVATRTLASYGVAVDVPAAWGFDYAVSRPDCITRDGSYADDPWAQGVPRAPYVQVGLIDRPVEAIGCMPKLPQDLPRAFGALPFDLWQPYVEIDRLGPDSGPDGTWTYRGWMLRRSHLGGAGVIVLVGPGQADLAAQVVASARRVRSDANGCASVAPRELTTSHRPPTARMPQPSRVAAVSICSYDRTRPGRPPMAASRRITGPAARALVGAIASAPAGGGPDRPHDCLTSMHGDQALVLHFLEPGERSPAEAAQAYVYADWCVGNGIVTATGSHALTADSCRPLYAVAPIVLWSTQGNLAPLCMGE